MYLPFDIGQNAKFIRITVETHKKILTLKTSKKKESKKILFVNVIIILTIIVECYIHGIN